MGIKYAVNEDFFGRWNRRMAYVLGYLYADGSLENASYLRGRYIRVTSTDRETIRKIRKWLDSKHTIVVLKPNAQHPGRTRYFLRIGSHKLYNDLLKLGLHPNKSLTVTFPDMPRLILADFVRGYFDGDGCVSFYTTKGITQRKIIKKLSVIFTSGSFDFLKKLCDTLKSELSLDQSKVYRSTRAFQLRYSTGDTVKIFEFLYRDCSRGLFLERKFRVFERYFRLRPERITPSIRKMLKLGSKRDS